MNWVKINDPFCQQCLIIDVEDNEEYLPYRQLKNKPSVRDTEPETDETEPDQDSKSPTRQKASPCDSRHATDATSPYFQMLIMTLNYHMRPVEKILRK